MQCWLLNTGWTGGPYGKGKRIALKTTRLMLEAALNGDLENTEYRHDPVFDLAVPICIDGVERDLLEPEKTWDDAEAYRKQAGLLVQLFDENFAKLGLDAAALNKTAAGRINAA